MSDYANSPACRMMASHCIFCGRPLVDAESVERGAGPECAPRYLDPIQNQDRQAVNALVYQAAVAAQQGKVDEVVRLAGEIEAKGYVEVANRIRERFQAAEKEVNVKVTIVEENGMLVVQTPYKRSVSEEFINAWRQIPGRRFDRARSANLIPVEQKMALWGLLKTFFKGAYGKGPKGVFRVV